MAMAMAIRLGFLIKNFSRKIILSCLRSCHPIQILIFLHTELGAPVFKSALRRSTGTFALNALVSGKPRTPIPGECGALAGDFRGFGLSLLPRYAGFSTAFGASIGERGP